MNVDLHDTDTAALTALLRDTIAADHFPLSPRVKRLRAILAKMEPPAAAAVVYPLPKLPAVSSLALAIKIENTSHDQNTSDLIQKEMTLVSWFVDQVDIIDQKVSTDLKLRH